MIGRIACRTFPPPSVQSVTSGASSSISSLMSPPVVAAKNRSVTARFVAVGLESRSARLDVVAGPVGSLTYRRFRTVDGVSDFGVGEVEDLLEHEDGAFQRAQRLEHHQHGHRHGLGYGDVFGGIRVGQDRVRQPRADVGFRWRRVDRSRSIARLDTMRAR